VIAPLKPLFALGQVVATPGVLRVFEESHDSPLTYLVRHQSGDWGYLDDHDKRENNFSLERGFRILSSYKTKNGTKFWIITEADRSSTTILLPEEY
jgi:hypothetical protein